MESEIIGEDFLDFKCPYCGVLNSFTTTAAGLPRECINCLNILLVPKVDGEVARRLPLPAEASRFRLRQFVPVDWKDLLEFQFDDEDAATTWIHTVSTVRSTEDRQPFFLAIETRDANKVVGTLGFRFFDPTFSQVELTQTISPAAGLPGLELESLKAALDFCFKEMNLHRVTVQCPAEDATTRQLCQELGLRQEAEFVKHRFVGGEWLSTFWFAMLEEEYFKNTLSGGGKTL